MSGKADIRSRNWRTVAVAAWAIIGILIILSVAGYVLGKISGALVPFGLGFLIVLMLQGSVGRLERRGMPRFAAVIVCFAAVLLVVSIVLVFIAPPIGRQLNEFADSAPAYLTQGQEYVQTMQDQFSQLVIPDWLGATVDSVVQALSSITVRIGESLASGIISAGSGLATLVFDFFIAFVIAFWALKDLPKIRQELQGIAGERYEADFENLVGTVTRVVGGYIRGQTIVSLITGTLAGVGLAILGVPYALVLGVITFVFNYIPYIGPIFTGLLAGVVGIFVSPLTAVLAVVVVIASQQVTDLFVTPRVMSEQVDLHPIIVMFALLVGGSLFGFAGMILSIPVAGTIKGLFVYYYERKTKRPLATENGALFRSSGCEDSDGAEVPCEDPSADGSSDPSTPSGGASS